MFTINFKVLLIRTFFIVLCFSNLVVGNSQTVHLIPNPTTVPPPTYYGVWGQPFIFNNNLYAGYIFSNGQSCLAKYKKDSLTLIKNPDSGSGTDGKVYIADGDKLYVAYDVANLAVYHDGDTSLSLIANPTGYFVQSSPVLYNDSVYVIARNQTTFNDVICVVHNDSLRVVASLPGEGIFSYGLTAYKSKLYTVYRSGSKPWQLASFNGSKITPIPNLPHTSSVGGTLIVYDKKLFTRASTDTGYGYNLLSYDGTGLNLIPNPTKGSVSNILNGLSDYYPIIYDNTLCFEYINSNDLQEPVLAQYDGSNIKLIPNPKENGDIKHLGVLLFGYIGYVDTVHNKLYLQYENRLGEYGGDSIKLISSPYYNYNYQGSPIVYNNQLYCNVEGFLSVLNGDSLKILFYSPYYGGGAVVYNEKLFGIYKADAIVDYNQLGYLDTVVLAVNYLNFSVGLQNKDAVLSWQTVNEINTRFFNVHRSDDGVLFKNIARINSIHNSTGTEISKYDFTDFNVFALHQNKLYYRLEEVDADGKSTYSNIRSVNVISFSVFTIFPNPAKDYINLVASENVTNAEITIEGIDGKILYTAKQNFIAGSPVRISLLKCTGQTLFITIKANNSQQQFKIVKK